MYLIHNKKKVERIPRYHKNLSRGVLSYQIQTCWLLAKDYTEKLLREERAFNCQNVYSYIGKARICLRQNCPYNLSLNYK